VEVLAGVRIAAMEERERRIGRNEALFREVNERIERVSKTLPLTTEKIEILCECGDQSCAESIEVVVPEYERVRQNSTLFFVRTGHAKLDVEEVVERHGSYDVVRKRVGEAADLARELDPRRD
jgi:hypothetical protein